MNRFVAGLLVCLCLQAGLWWRTKDVLPEMTVVPNVPGKTAVRALAMGDEEAYFRLLALYMQNFGDTFGRFTALRYYDFDKLYQWWTLLDTLDSRSNMIPTLAANYFSQTQNTPDVRYVVDYLYAHATRDVAHKWWWLLQSIYLSSHKLKDWDLAAKVAAPMLAPGVPVWAQQMVAVVHEKRGEFDDALAIMESIQKNAGTLEEKDLKYMQYFIDERIKKLDKARQ